MQPVALGHYRTKPLMQLRTRTCTQTPRPVIRCHITPAIQTCLAVLIAICISAFWAQNLRAQIQRSKPEKRIFANNQTELDQAWVELRPGVTLVIGSGNYRGGIYLRQISGSAGSPVIIRAANPHAPPIFSGNQTGLQLSGCHHIHLEHLVIEKSSSNGINIDDGGTKSGSSTDIHLDNIVVRDIGPHGNRDGIKLSGVRDFLVSNCTIERWGDAGSAIDMVGCQGGSISGCDFFHGESIPANGVQTKGGTSDVTIENCRFVRAGSRALNIGGSTGKPYFRPLGAKHEAKEIRVHDCTLIGSDASVAFVGVDGAEFAHNTIYLPTRWIFRILQESTGDEMTPCRNVSIHHNLIVFQSDQIRSHINIGSGTAAETFQFENNHWYCKDRPTESRPQNLPSIESKGIYGQPIYFRNEERLDLQITGTQVTHGARQSSSQKK